MTLMMILVNKISNEKKNRNLIGKIKNIKIRIKWVAIKKRSCWYKIMIKLQYKIRRKIKRKRRKNKKRGNNKKNHFIMKKKIAASEMNK